MTHEHPHVHPKQPDVEDSCHSHYQVMTQAVEELLVAKGILTAEGMRKGIESLDFADPAWRPVWSRAAGWTLCSRSAYCRTRTRPWN